MGERWDKTTALGEIRKKHLTIGLKTQMSQTCVSVGCDRVTDVMCCHGRPLDD